MLGSWNRAILTPAWIATTVLGLPKNAPLEVLVPLDAFAQFQIRHQGLTVIPARDRLLLQAETSTAEVLTRAMECARRAIDELPRTPLHACGINIRYASDEPPRVLVERTRCKTEQLLSETGYELRIRRRGETLKFMDGTLNIIADIPTTGPCTVTLNFERQSTERDDILAWLARPVVEYESEANKVLKLIAEEGESSDAEHKR
ncbi:MAG: hypothetical protein U1D55_02715 [Phycisphaerae bacterium]